MSETMSITESGYKIEIHAREVRPGKWESTAVFTSLSDPKSKPTRRIYRDDTGRGSADFEEFTTSDKALHTGMAWATELAAHKMVEKKAT